ncbi:hypothetical protein C5612_15705 [Pseudomonas frederiksbergensis]|uniref:Glycosyltransferase RgtA/B/C/D-like domain-containing protein n=1 Tax=Pseudomonas frederiksbergensis TaxID=104087 RepID=A0A2S8HL88_9PSED|nr:hypothetical protein [Pseudomonas frederiksbergensis]PQP03269.1 hypothetical protein C5612_15705 [Pseudomonas frederiksbergensis]
MLTLGSNTKQTGITTAENFVRLKGHIFFAVVAFLVYVYGVQSGWGGATADDGSFFLRYAENMTHGEFWKWNLGESPIWGSSAPLYPLYLSLLMKLGASPLVALVGGGSLLGCLALTLTSWMLVRQFGYIAGALFVACTFSDGLFMWFAGTAGLESPLTIAVLSYGLWALLKSKSGIHVGVAAGLLAVQKLDLIPAAFFLICAWSVSTRSIPVKSIVLAAAIAATWYGFAWIYFGLPVPNSFITKTFFQNQQPYITWQWFGKYLLIENNHYWIVILALAKLIKLDKKSAPLIIFLGGLTVTHLIAYSLKFPLERYDWYAMPSLYSLFILGSLGAQSIWNIGTKYTYIIKLLLIVFLGYIVSQSYTIGKQTTLGVQHYLNLEKDRTNAGMWVSEHTPKNFKLLTCWGSPAFFSHRQSYDSSFLNRHYESSDLIATYAPEVIITDTGRVGDSYTLVKIFNKAINVGINYPFGVHIRNDVLSQVTDVDHTLKACSASNSCASIDTPFIDLIAKPVLGDKYGVLRIDEKPDTIFVHPGETQPTSFELDSSKFEKWGVTSLTLTASVSPHVPENVIARGGAVVGVTVYQQDNVTAERKVVKSGEPTTISLPIVKDGNYRVVIDNNKVVDTNWVLIKLEQKK